LKKLLSFCRTADGLLARAEEFLIVVVFMGLLSGGVAVLLSHLPWRDTASWILVIVGPAVLAFGVLRVVLKSLSGSSRMLLGGTLLALVGGFLQLSSGVDALLRLLTLILALLGASLSVRLRAHVAIEVATRFVSASVRRWVDAVANFGACLILAALVPHAVGYATDALAAGEVSFVLGLDGVGVSAAFGKSLLALAMVAMSWRFGVLALEVCIDPKSWEARRGHQTSALT
jgi:TRAP-type C4-dicarboxylate transport system permease small subunit